MPTQDIQQEMMQYFMLLNEAERRSVLLMIKTFLSGKQQPDNRISIEQYNQELDEAEAEFEKGEFVSHEEVVAMSKKWAHGR
jgi:predicted transcriptional regulator